VVEKQTITGIIDLDLNQTIDEIVPKETPKSMKQYRRRLLNIRHDTKISEVSEETMNQKSVSSVHKKVVLPLNAASKFM